MAKVSELATPNLEAYDLIFRSRRALDLAKFEEAYQLAGQALALDPDSPMARYQAWVTTDWRTLRPPGWDRRGAVRDALARAEAVADRLPERERSLLRLERAFYGRKPEIMEPLCEQLTTAFPLDKEILTECGTFHFHYYYAGRDRALAYLDRALQLDPTYAPAIMKLCMVLQTLGGAEEKLPLLRQLAAAATEVPLMQGLASTLLAARAEDDAVALLERSRVARGLPFLPLSLAFYRAHVGRPAEAEAMARNCLESLPRIPEAERQVLREVCTTVLFESLTSQGRRREALEALREQTGLSPLDAAVFRMAIHSATGALDDARTTSRGLAELGVNDDPEVARWAANWMVEGGLVREAAPLFALARASQHWEELPFSDRLWAEAISALANGAPDGESRLRAALDHPHLGGQFDSARVLARLLRTRGDCAGAIPLLERARRIPPSIVVQYRAMQEPQLIHWLADCYEKTGDLAKARERNDEFLRLWAKADPDLPLLAEAKALQGRLARADGAKAAK